MRQKTGSPALVILMHEQANPPASDPIANIKFIIFNVIIKTILFDQGNIILLQIIFAGIVNLFHIIPLFTQKIHKTPGWSGPMFKITDSHFIFPFAAVQLIYLIYSLYYKQKICFVKMMYLKTSIFLLVETLHHFVCILLLSKSCWNTVGNNSV